MSNHDFNSFMQPQGTLNFNQFGGASPGPGPTGLTDLSFGLPDLSASAPALDTSSFDFSGLFDAPQGGGGGPFDFLTDGSAFGKGGWGVPAANAVSGALGAYTGLQQLKQGEEMFDFQKGVTNRNLANQAASFNTQLRDQYAGRFSAGTPQAAKIEDYMAKNRVSGAPI